MVTAVSLNPSIDRTITIGEFTYGGMNRVLAARNDASGKAVNVAINSATLGMETECIGFLYRENGKLIEQKLLLYGVKTDFLWQEGRVRTNIKLLDSSKGIVTEINEAGFAVTDEQMEQMTNHILEHAQVSDFLVLNGSLPPNCPKDYYRQIIEAVEGLDCRCVLDAEGVTLSEGIKAKPFLIKPNLHELETVIGHSINGIDEAAKAARSFVEQGVTVVVASLGGEGAILCDADETLYCPAMDIPVKSTVGAGDAMVTGLIAGYLAEEDTEQVLRMGMACASAEVMIEGSQAVEKAKYKELLKKTEIRRLRL